MKLRLFMILLLLTASGQSNAADEVVLTFNIPSRMGVPIGQSTVPGYEDSIDVLAWSLGFNNVDNTPVVLPLSISKQIDLSSARLVQSAIAGQVFDEVWLTVTDPGVGSQFSLRLVLNQARIVSVSAGGVDGTTDSSNENLAISCESFSLTVNARDANGNFTDDAPQVSGGTCGG
ncbi:MAG: type VI secretion system tube protein Hcp [Gammaproteobacteria bacterium]